MGTKSNRSSGTQHNPRGVTQGNTLVDPNTGLPIDVIQDDQGVKRLAVDAAITADNVTVTTDDLVAADDAVRVEDPSTGAHVKVNVDGSIDANVKVDAASDTIAIADASTGDKATVNPDGSLNVNVVSTGGATGVEKNVFASISSVASGSNTTIQTYIVPVGKTDLLQLVEVSGTNIAQYEVLLNAVVIARKYTYFGNSLNDVFNFNSLKLLAGDVILVKVLHNRSNLGNFNSRIQVSEV